MNYLIKFLKINLTLELASKHIKYIENILERIL